MEMAMLNLILIGHVVGSKSFAMADTVARFFGVIVKMSVYVFVTMLSVHVALLTAVEGLMRMFVHWLLNNEMRSLVFLSRY